jgi:two-component sensor histidine kinase
MIDFPRPFLLLLIVSVVLRAAAQSPSPAGQPSSGPADTKTMLELNAAFLQVNSQAQYSLDSTLIIASRAHAVSAIPIITEGMNDAFCSKYSSWMNTGRADSMIALLPGFNAALRAEGQLLIGAWYAFQPGDRNYRTAIAFLLQAREAAHRLGKIEWEAQCHCLLTKAYYMLADTANGNKWFFALVQDPAFAGLEAIQAKARNYAGMYCPFMPRTHRFRLDNLSEALKLFQHMKDTGNQINTLMDIAYMSFAAGDAPASEKAARLSLLLQQAWHFPYTQYTYDLLAFFGLFKGDYPAALQMALSSLNATENTGDRHYLPYVYIRIADSYGHLSKQETSFEWDKKALQAEIDMGGEPGLYMVLQQLGDYTSQIRWGRKILTTVQNTIARYPPANGTDKQRAYVALGACWEGLGHYPAAKRYYEMAWQLESEVLKIRGGMRNNSLRLNLGWINYRTGNYKESRKYFASLLEKPYVKDVNNNILISTYQGLLKVDSCRGDYKSALHYFHLFEQLEEDVSSEKQTRALLDLNVRYETLQREKRLQELQAASRLQEQKETHTRRLFYGGFALLGFIIVMVYIRYYNNKRKNRQLRAQKEEIDVQNSALQELNRKQTTLIDEKEWLLREIHHRVKNNLQIITGLLLSQSEFLRDQAAVDVMVESQRRVQAMSLIHQKLYNSENLSSIYMPEYIGELVDFLRESFVMQHKVVFRLDIAAVWLDVSKAVPLGLILNEVITNAFKYAFPHSDDDRISIRLAAEGSLVSLEVEDNGRGLPKDFDIAASNSFGMILMRGMAEDLEGTFEVGGANGTRIVIRFGNITPKETVDRENS